MQIEYKGVDMGLREVLIRLRAEGVEEPSRNGPVRRFQEPVILKNLEPWNRVIQSPLRDANPFFHFVEALWMLAGRNDVASVKFYNSQIGIYSDDGFTLRGTAYGYRWRHHFGYDQLKLAIERLRANPEDRRIVMTMWDPREEWKNPTSKDLSCNLQVIFSTRLVGEKRHLDMTVTNRSNDIIYGCLGSNVFHFSFLQEYVAYHAGLELGFYYQIANNLHGYLDNEVFKRCYENTTNIRNGNPGARRQINLTTDPSLISEFLSSGRHSDDPYLKEVASPLVEAYRIYKLKETLGRDIKIGSRVALAKDILLGCLDRNLANAGIEWLNRRKAVVESRV